MTEPIDTHYDLFIPEKHETPPDKPTNFGRNWREIELWQRRFREAVDRAIAASVLTISTDPAAAITPDAPSIAGSSGEVADAGHQHGWETGTPLSLAVGDTANEGGSLGTVTQRIQGTRASHRHGVPTGVPAAVGAANAAGSSTSIPRLDHVHAGAAVDHTHPAIYATVHRSTNQLFTDLVEATVQFNTLIDGSGLLWDSGNFRITILTAGLYSARASCKWDAHINGFRTLHLFKLTSGGTSILLDDDHKHPSTAATWTITNHVQSHYLRMAVGDHFYCTAMTQGASPANVNMLSENYNSPWLSVARISP